MNLCVNARDAMPDGGVITVSTTEITADALFLAAHPEAKEGRYARVSVEDTGVGMDTDVRDRVFDPFFTTKSEARGSGLGLATVYGIVRQHNGLVELESMPGAGSRFDLFFPLTSEPLDQTDSGPEHAAIGGSATILVVEDENQPAYLATSRGEVGEMPRDVVFASAAVFRPGSRRLFRNGNFSCRSTIRSLIGCWHASCNLVEA